MRTTLTRLLGALQLSAAAVLALVAIWLPGRSDVAGGFQEAEDFTSDLRRQIARMETHVAELRDPQLVQMMEQLDKRAQQLPGMLRTQRIDFETLAVVREAAGDVGDGLAELATTFDEKNLEGVESGLSESATFLEKVATASGEVADQLDQSTASLQEDAELLAEVLEQSPLDLKAAREVHAGLERFNASLKRLDKLVAEERLEEMSKGTKGLNKSLTQTADQVEALADYHYPVVEFDGYLPIISLRKFWPAGDDVATGLRDAADGIAALDEQIAAVKKELPSIRSVVTESEGVIGTTEKSLATALEQLEKVQPLLERIPENSKRLSEELPETTDKLSQVLRETERLRTVAASLRKAKASFGTTAENWEGTRKTLLATATMLNKFGEQVDMAIEHREGYESLVDESVEFSEALVEHLGSLTRQFASRLEEEEKALAEMQGRLQKVEQSLPAYRRQSVALLRVGGLLLWLGAAIFGIQGVLALGRVPPTTSASADSSEETRYRPERPRQSA